MSNPSNTNIKNTFAWHALSAEKVLAELKSAKAGLKDKQVHQLREEYGSNTLKKFQSDGILKIFINQINNPLVYVLLASALLALMTGKTIDAVVVLGVVIANALIGLAQEYKAGKSIEALMGMVSENATVIRNNQKEVILASELVPGDIVLLQSGDKVPADIRILETKNLQVEEAVLTGESVPVIKTNQIVPVEASLGDRINIAYSGTLVTYGTCQGVVIAIAGQTEIGKISTLLSQTHQLETPLTKQVAVVGKYLTIAILVVAVLLFGISLIRGYQLADSVVASITLAVGAIPEGLPAVITIALSIGVQRMARRQAIIRRLPAVETLGSTTVICSDKTGTLTKNEMTVQEVWTYDHKLYQLTGVGYEPTGEILAQNKPLKHFAESLQQLLIAGALCNDSTLKKVENQWQITGDPTEGALIVAAHKARLDSVQLSQSYPRLDEIAFESENQYMATLNSFSSNNKIFTKGAPEIIISQCHQLTQAQVKQIHHQVELLASQGMRVLAMAEKSVSKAVTNIKSSDTASGFKFLGLQAMIDPPRTEVIQAIQKCKQAGIDVKMITGDHLITAIAIGKQLGIIKSSDQAMTGKQLSEIDDTQLKKIVGSINIFARVAPEHKLRIVRALQANNHIVAMTGDGVNDAPALKQSNIGVAMGITGTAVSKEAADIVLTNDNFASIVAAIEEGRRVYDNLIKSLAFILPTNIGLAIIMLVAVAFFPITNGIPLLPVLPTQILWINLVAAITLALPLAFEVAEPNIITRPPRRPTEPILSKFIIFRTFFVAILMSIFAVGVFLWQYTSDISKGINIDIAISQAQTMAVTTIIFFQICYVINCRSLKDPISKIGWWSNPTIYFGIGVLLMLQMGFIYLPFMQMLFKTTALSWNYLAVSIIVAFVIGIIISLEKKLIRLRERSK